MKLLLVLILISTQAFAICTKPVTLLDEGAKTECKGYLFTPEKELEVRIKIANFSNMEELVKKTEELNVITEARLNNQLDLNQKLITEVNSQNNRTFLQNAVFFTLGALVTGYLATNVGK